MNKKHQVIEKLYKNCQNRNDFIFHNDEVKKACAKAKFGNPFDVTKIDNRDKLPQVLLKNDVAIIHLGGGKHKFIKGINNVYHNFEALAKTQDWRYKKSILNQFNSSESNILSVANNQRILHDFLFGFDAEFADNDINKCAKTYLKYRPKTSLKYNIGGIKTQLTNIQIKINLTIEFEGIIGFFDAKNTADNFSIYQLYHPFLYYHNANKTDSLNGKIKEIYGIYVVPEKSDTLKLWCYTFTNPLDINSIKLVKSTTYNLH